MKTVITLLLAACLGVTACASSGTNAAAMPEEPTTVVVDNQALMDMTIYVYRSSERIRVGTATALAKSHLRIPPNVLFGSTPLRFMADPIGANRLPITEELTVSPGDTVTMIIPFR